MKNDAALWQRGMEWGKELLAPPPRRHAEAYRHELKYLISYADKAELAVRMAPVLHLDPHAKQGGYFIRSLYFDDYWNTAYAEKDAGVLLRQEVPRPRLQLQRQEHQAGAEEKVRQLDLQRSRSPDPGGV